MALRVMITAVAFLVALGAANAQSFFTNGVPPAGSGNLPLSGQERLPMDTGGTPPSVSVTSQQLGAFGATQGGGNGIIAGDFNQNLWQRGVVISNIANSQYTADRFFAWTASGSEMRVSRDTTPSESPSGFGPASAKVERTGNGTAQQCFGQVLASADVSEFAGHTVEFSFWVAGGSGFSGGNLNYTLSSGTGVDEGARALAFSLNGLGGGSSGWSGFQRVADSTVVPGAGSVRIVAVAAVPSGVSELGISFCWTPSGTPTNDYVALQGVQLVTNDVLSYANGYSGLTTGTQASTWRGRPMAQEVELQRWYFQTFAEPGSGFANGLSGLATGANACLLVMPVKVMRVAPTVTFGPLSASTWQVQANVSSALASPFLSGTAVNGALNVTATSVSALAVNSPCLLEGAGGGSVINLDAELN